MNLHEIYTRFPTDFPLPMVLDGSTGTSLMRRGMPKGVCTELWVDEHPEVIRAIQADYAAAGSDALYCPTFGANRPAISRHGFAGDLPALNSRLSALSGGHGKLVGGDLSPTGRFLIPFGDADFEEIVEIYAEQAAAITENVDFFVIETMLSLAETRAAVTGVRKVSSKPIFVTLTVDERGKTLSGDTLEASLLSLAELGISAFGCNCSTGPQTMLTVLKPLVGLAQGLGIPLIAKPNAGMPVELPDGSSAFDLNAEEFGQAIPDFLAAGICVLGGCCGTDADYIRAIRAAVDCADSIGRAETVDPALLCATNKAVDRFVPGTESIEVTEDIADDFDDCEDDVPLLKLAEGGAELLLEACYMFDRPFALCGNAEEIEAVRRVFPGKIIVVE